MARASSATATAATASESATFIEWNSFIGQSYVSSNDFFCDAPFGDQTYFEGNDRTYAEAPARDAYTATGAPRSKITARVGTSFDLSGQGLDLNAATYNGWFFKGVGTTKSFDEDYNLLRAMNAGSQGVKLASSSSTATTAFRRVTSDVPNPLCQILGVPALEAPAINWEFSLTANRSGSVLLQGKFDTAPNTEILWERSTNTADPSSFVGGCLYRASNKGFQTLAAAFPQASISLEVPALPTGGCIVY